MNIPNILTIFRIILVPVYLKVFFSNIKNRYILALLIFILAGITDFLDGYIARKYNLVSKLGKILDPLADKLMTFAVLFSLVKNDYIPLWILVILSLKELTMIIGASILYIFKGKKALASNIFGKLATVFFYITTFITFLCKNSKVSNYLFIITVFLNLLAFVNYLSIYIKIRKK